MMKGGIETFKLTCLTHKIKNKTYPVFIRCCLRMSFLILCRFFHLKIDKLNIKTSRQFARKTKIIKFDQIECQLAETQKKNFAPR